LNLTITYVLFVKIWLLPFVAWTLEISVFIFLIKSFVLFNLISSTFTILSSFLSSPTFCTKHFPSICDSVNVESDNYVCPVCQNLVECTDLVTFNRHIDICLNKNLVKDCTKIAHEEDRNFKKFVSSPKASKKAKSFSIKGVSIRIVINVDNTTVFYTVLLYVIHLRLWTLNFFLVTSVYFLLPEFWN
jgi:hypothetical protein